MQSIRLLLIAVLLLSSNSFAENTSSVTEESAPTSLFEKGVNLFDKVKNSVEEQRDNLTSVLTENTDTAPSSTTEEQENAPATLLEKGVSFVDKMKNSIEQQTESLSSTLAEQTNTQPSSTAEGQESAPANLLQQGMGLVDKVKNQVTEQTDKASAKLESYSSQNRAQQSEETTLVGKGLGVVADMAEKIKSERAEAERKAIHIAEITPYKNSAYAPQKVVDECREVGVQISESVVAAGDDRGFVIKREKQVDPSSHERFLEINIITAASQRTWMGNHTKSMAIELKLFIDGTLQGETIEVRDSGGGPLGKLKTSCGVMERIAEALGRDAALWLQILKEREGVDI